MFQPIPLPHRADFSEEDMASRAAAFYQSMKTRRTVRDYDVRAVPRALIETCIETAGTAPSGANQQPWHFVAISDAEIKRAIRLAAEAEEQKFYHEGHPDWLAALEPIGTGANKPHLQDAPWLIVVFAQRWGVDSGGEERIKHYYVPESVGIATGMLLCALHQCGLASLTHTPNPMGFLNTICQRPKQEKPVMIIAVGHASEDAVIPKAALKKKPLDEIASFF